MRGRLMWDAEAKRSWWCSLAASAVLGVPACTSRVGVRTVEHALVAKIGPPLPDAKLLATPWYRGVGAWYDHRNDAPTVLGWLGALPSRLGCDEFVCDALTPPSLERAQFYRLTCRLRVGTRDYVISVTTLLAATSPSTVIVAYIDD